MWSNSSGFSIIIYLVLEDRCVHVVSTNSNLSTYTKIIQKNVGEVTVGANSVKAVTGIDCAYDGYKTIGIVGATSNSDSMDVVEFYCSQSVSTVRIKFRNVSSSNITLTQATILVLCIKEI